MPLRILLLYLIKKFNKSIERSNKTKMKELERKFSELDEKMRYSKEEDVEQNLTNYSQIIAANSNSLEAYVERGIIYYKIGNYERSINDFTKAIEIAPCNEELYKNRGDVYGDVKKMNMAISDFTKAININPNYAAAYYDRALTYLEAKNYENAINDFSQVLIQKPLFMPQAYINLSRALRRTKRYYSAIEVYQTFMENYDEFCQTTDCDKKKFLEMAKKEALETIGFLRNIQDLIVFIEVLRGPTKGHKFFIKGFDDIILGNKQGLDISLCEDTLISSEHAKLSINKDGYLIEDLKSARGTYLNKEKITERVRLTYGDLITIGKTTLQFKVGNPKEKSRFHIS